MARKVVVLSMIVALLVSGFGCASTRKTNNFNGLSLNAEGKTSVNHYTGNAWGIYLLSIPLLTGDTEKETIVEQNKIQINIAVMKDTVNLDSVADMVSRSAAADGCNILEDVNSTLSSVLIWFPLPIFFYKSVTVQGNGLK